MRPLFQNSEVKMGVSIWKNNLENNLQGQIQDHQMATHSVTSIILGRVIQEYPRLCDTRWKFGYFLIETIILYIILYVRFVWYIARTMAWVCFYGGQ